MADKAGTTARSATGGCAAPSQRLTQLHVAHGNALFAARGLARRKRRKPSPEPASRLMATRTRPNDWRPTTAYGPAATCEASCRRCGRTQRPSSATSRRDPIRPRPASLIAPLGITCWFAGEYREARDHWNARSPCSSPAVTTIWPFASDMDPGVAAMAYLAIALWPLGEVDRAISLIDRMQTRIADLTHVGTLAAGKLYAALFELMRGDRARAAPNAFELARLAREHDLPMCRAFGGFSRVGRPLRAARSAAGSRTCAAASDCCANRTFCCSTGY